MSEERLRTYASLGIRVIVVNANSNEVVIDATGRVKPGPGSCGPCRAMIPHEREMVGRLKEKPFVLVSISADEKKETLTDFLKKESMPWTHWWIGTSGPMMEDWNIRYFPTIYVLDHKGVIRFKDIRGEKLEEAVNELLKEMEAKK